MNELGCGWVLWRLTALWWLTTTTAAVAKPPPLPAHETPPHVEFWRGKIDWNIAQHEAVGRLAEYVRVDTVNPPGNESRGVDFLASVLDREGIAYQTVELEEGRASLIARVEGVGADTPLCLLHHIDTVGFDEDSWTNTYAHGPLSGAQSEGFVWGRGVLDAKGLGTLELMTLVWLKRLEVPLIRDVVLLALADEEVSNRGAKQIAEMWKDIGCSYLINEGGLGLQGPFFEGQAVHAISTAEKGVLWVDVHATGQRRHGSTEYPDEAPDRLLQAMNAIARYRPDYTLDPDVKRLLYNVGKQGGGMRGLALRAGFWRRLFARGKLKKEPALAATMTDTVHLTGVSGADEPNVVPERLTATYDCRLLPGTSPDAHLERLKKLTRKVEGIELEVRLEGEANRSPVDDKWYSVIAHYATEGRENAVAGPVLSVGYTDSLLLRPVGVKAYGYVPFEVTQEVAETIHGPDERVPVEQVREGLRRLFSMVVDFAGNP